MVKSIEQYEIFWISLDPTQGSEISKTRPCVVVSPNELNRSLRTVIIIPITSTVKIYPWRVECWVGDRKGSIATDHIRVVDKSRLVSKIGVLSQKEVKNLKLIIEKMFVE